MISLFVSSHDKGCRLSRFHEATSGPMFNPSMPFLTQPIYLLARNRPSREEKRNGHDISMEGYDATKRIRLSLDL